MKWFGLPLGRVDIVLSGCQRLLDINQMDDRVMDGEEHKLSDVLTTHRFPLIRHQLFSISARKKT
jgi:hypothetical protein